MSSVTSSAGTKTMFPYGGWNDGGCLRPGGRFAFAFGVRGCLTGRRMNWQPPSDDPYTLTIYGAIVLTGVAICFFGHRIFRVALGILLAIAGAGAGAYLAGLLGLPSRTAMVVGIVIGALAGLVLSFVFVRGAAAVAGVILGYILFSPQLAEMPGLEQALVLLAICGAGALLGVFIANPVIVLATAFAGAFEIIYGGWFFFGGPPILILGDDPAAGWQVVTGNRMAFIAMVALGVLGAATQFARHWRSKRE